MNEVQCYSMLKAAALGYAQSLYNNGANDAEVAALTRHYVDDNGTLTKRAARQDYIKACVLQRLAAMGY